MPTKLVKLGNDGPEVPAMGFGLMGLSHSVYGSISSDEDRFAILDRAYELGCTFWDTADLYGDSEQLLSKWFQRTGKRDQIFLATKFGFVKGSSSYEIDSSGEYCKKACAESLRALGVDSIDLYYMHHANPKTPIEETMRAMVELKEQGKIKHIGLSSISSATLRRACKIAPVAVVQTDYSPFARDIEGAAGTNLLATCRELGVAVVAAMPLNRGMLTSTFANGRAIGDEKDIRPKLMPRFMNGNQEKNARIVHQFEGIAQQLGYTTSQLSLAWLLKQGNDIIPIPGTKKRAYLEENWEAVHIELGDKEEADIRNFLDSNTVAGPCLPPEFASYGMADTIEEEQTQVDR